ncbi:DUF3775 domain-containing protein [Pseudomonas sp. PP3]|uniref:DUF3775 domain-containing protein n=1 Tax=Pseudomonas sp. PP3 TaxID=2815936 RepID=UPI001BB01E39|nr:DUF3775 domain-containing protein [Pseudomonas sp. PP3]
MQHLSIPKAATIARLAANSHEAYLKRHPGKRVIGSSELKSLIREPDSDDQVAFEGALRALSADELLDLVALMCVGRGEYVENSEDQKSILSAFARHLHAFSKGTHEQLLDYISGNEAVIHRYLAQGLERVEIAFF